MSREQHRTISVAYRQESTESAGVWVGFSRRMLLFPCTQCHWTVHGTKEEQHHLSEPTPSHMTIPRIRATPAALTPGMPLSINTSCETQQTGINTIGSNCEKDFRSARLFLQIQQTNAWVLAALPHRLLKGSTVCPTPHFGEV